MRSAIVTALIALALAGYGFVALAATGANGVHVVVDGVPMEQFRPPHASGPVPAVVVVHGFAGSGELMAGFADTLVANNIGAVLLDVDGHGTNPRPLDVTDPIPPIDHDIEVAVRQLRSLSWVDGQAIALLGHSLGAQAVTDYGSSHRDIVATVAISLPHALTGARPHDLLLLVGGLEFASFQDAARQSGARVVVVPGVEHISILYATDTHTAMVSWLNAAFGRGNIGGPVHPRDRLLPGLALLLAFALGFVPIVALALPRRDRGPAPEGVGRSIAGLVVGCVLAVLIARFLPTTRLPIAVAGYSTGFFVLIGLGLLAGRAGGRLGPDRPFVHNGYTTAIVLTLYAVVAITLPLQLGLTHALPVGARWWLLPVIAVGVGVMLLGVELAGAGRWWLRGLCVLAIAAASVIAALAGTAPGFIILVLPLLVILLAWQAFWASVLYRRSAPRWLAPLVGAVIVAWPIATTLPLTT